MNRTVIIQSCVGGGPMERLATRLTDIRRTSTVDSLYRGDEWRELMSSSSFGRVRARLGAFIKFPLVALSGTIRQRGAVAVPTTNPFFLPGFMVATRPLHRNPVIPLVYDLWPDAAEVSGALSAGSWPTRFAVKFNRWWLHRADGVVFIGPNMAKRISERYGRPPSSAIIETGADLAEFLSSDDDVGDTQLDRWLEKGPVASYVGNMGAMHDVDTLAEAVRLLNRNTTGQGVRVLVAASGPGPSHLRAAWANCDETMFRFEEPLADELWRRALIASDIALVTLRNAAANTSLPSKTFSAMAAGCAIVAVAPSGSDLADCIQSSQAGIVIAPGDAAGLAKTLISYGNDRELLRTHQDAARKAARELYDMPALARRWDEFVRPLDGSPNLLVMASVPPPLAGQSAATILLLSALDAAQVNVRVINIGDTISGRQTVSDAARRALAVAGIWVRVAGASVRTRRKDTKLYLQLGQSPAAMLRDMPPLMLAKILGWECIGHVHGGGWRVSYENLPSVLKRVYSALIRDIDRFMVLTPRLALMATDVVPESAVVVVGNGVDPDLERAALEEPSALTEPAVVLFLSNLIPAKGANTVIEAARLAHARGDSTVFVLAGSIPSGQELPALPPNVTYVGAVGGNSKHELFRSASVFVLPTSYPTEGEPIAILEAMHFGLPIVTCDQGGIADVVGPDNGLIIEAGDPSSLLGAIDELCDDSARWGQISAANRLAAQFNHSSSSHQARMVDLLLGSDAVDPDDPSDAWTS